jgi:hypothetical protein
MIQYFLPVNNKAQTIQTDVSIAMLSSAKKTTTKIYQHESFVVMM